MPWTLVRRTKKKGDLSSQITQGSLIDVPTGALARPNVRRILGGGGAAHCHQPRSF